jgi:hypothetical protein
MKLNWWALSIVACMVGVVLTGCARPDRPLVGAVAIGRVSGGNEHCDWSFNLGQHGKMDEATLQTTPKPGKTCKEHKWGTGVTSKKLYVGDGTDRWEVTDIPFVEFFTKGSCRRCWTNTAGGMTCIEYPGNC